MKIIYFLFWFSSTVFASHLPDEDITRPRKSIVQISKKYLGIRYRWGGTTSRGFDCSGFVLSMYRKIGTNLPRTAREQFKVGISVSKKDLKPGDRVFFGGKRPTHTGIYIGDNKFIHSSRGGVKINSLDEKYYSKRYLGARRST